MQVRIAWCTLLCLLVAGPVFADGAARLDLLSREIVASKAFQDPAPRPASSMFSGAKAARVKHAAWSLLVPGWSQWKSGNKHRAAVFATAELGVWTSYGVFQLQGHRRRDSYEDFAVQFANVQGTDHDDAYWRAVALYLSSDDYNEDVRRDMRVGITPDGPQYGGADEWQWTSPERRSEYRVLRAQSQDAFDRSTLVVLFAVVNRVIAFVDAVRTGPDGTQAGLTVPHTDLRVHVGVTGDEGSPTPTVSFHHGF